ncbi:hypothetical protein [Pectinatus frisingensis]|uniref:hypothetical protein n=1 Tax=Pectinatus frisingensis TaxID=865 RepID=UPI0018C5B823|nr:hypothetical protein [Pectinatus frisingensis]
MKKNCVRYLILIVMGLIILAPFFYAVIVSFESAEDTLAFPPVFVPGKIYIKSYLEAFRTAPLVIFIINSFVVTIGYHRAGYNVQSCRICICLFRISV